MSFFSFFLTFFVGVMVPWIAMASPDTPASAKQLFPHHQVAARHDGKRSLTTLMKGLLEKMPNKLRTHHSNESPMKKSLREESMDLATASSSTTVVKKNGWMEVVAYDYEWYKDCKHPWFKDVADLNTCGLSQDGTNYGMISVMAYPDWNKYVLTQSYYSDSACTQPTGQYVDYSAPILICSWDVLYHVIPAPLNPVTDNLNGFAYGIFNSVNNCTSGSVDGLLEVYYLKLNFCYSTSSNDVKFSSCSSDGLTVKTYSTTNGSCGGSAISTDVWASSDVCTTNGVSELTSGWWFSGPATFVCEM